MSCIISDSKNRYKSENQIVLTFQVDGKEVKHKLKGYDRRKVLRAVYRFQKGQTAVRKKKHKEKINTLKDVIKESLKK